MTRPRAVLHAALLALPALLWGVLACSSGPAPDPSLPPEEPRSLADLVVVDDGDEEEWDEQPLRDGPWLYMRNCESCHGPKGDGRGPLALELGKLPRDFSAGGFAFGNTREQLFKTVSSGVPGSNPMPGFAGTLTEQERWLVVDHVRTLMPPPEEEPRNSELIVTSEPRVARGLLPPIVEGAPRRPRGLLVGLPVGLTFEYRVDDVALLGVRQGPFANREDWGGRGGGHLRPLGTPILVLRKGDGSPTFRELREGAEPVELEGRLKSTWTRGEMAGLVYELVDPRGAVVAAVLEQCRGQGLSLGPAVTRGIEIAARRAATLELDLTGSVASVWPAELHRREDLVAYAAGEPALVDDWSASDETEGLRTVLLARLPLQAHRAEATDAVRFVVPVEPGAPATVRATLLRSAEWSDELRRRLSGEIER
jgi:mono/diheme cytochrome c family protein